MTTTIRIITASGNTITRKATVTDWTNGLSTAIVGRHEYRIARRDADGPIWIAAGSILSARCRLV